MNDDDEGWLFYGHGSMHELSDRDEERPRLLGLRSVATGAAWAMHKSKPPRKRRMGFKVR